LTPHGNIRPAADARLLDELTTVVSHAAAAILAVRAASLDPRQKADRSPVTAADDAAEGVILDGVSKLLPGIPIVSEEAAQTVAPRHSGGDFLLVDPLDGTRELLAGRDEFTVNLAMISGGRPQLGIIAAPAVGLVWRAGGTAAERLRLAPGTAADAARERTPLRTRRLPDTGLVAAVSRLHLDAQTEAFLARLPKVERIESGSAVKFCRLAEGAADLYPRLSPTSEWDVAAGDAVLTAAGGVVTAWGGGPLSYGRNQPDFGIPAFVAWGDPSAPARLGL